MIFGMRKPSFKKSFKARTTGKAKRALKRALIPGYGMRGVGLIKNPKKATYNKIYNTTSFSLSRLLDAPFMTGHSTKQHNTSSYRRNRNSSSSSNKKANNSSVRSGSYGSFRSPTSQLLNDSSSTAKKLNGYSDSIRVNHITSSNQNWYESSINDILTRKKRNLVPTYLVPNIVLTIIVGLITSVVSFPLFLRSFSSFIVVLFSIAFMVPFSIVGIYFAGVATKFNLKGNLHRAKGYAKKAKLLFMLNLVYFPELLILGVGILVVFSD